MLIVFLGPPGAGKGTQATRLTEWLKIPALSTGEMLREAKASGSSLGLAVSEKLDTGQLIDDQTVFDLIVDHLDQPYTQNGALLDGFPRSVKQAEDLDQYLAKNGRRLDSVILLTVPEDELSQRLTERFLKLDCPRPEDHPEHVPRRLELYNSVTSPLIEYYSNQELLVRVDGTGLENEVFQRIQSALETNTSSS